MVLEPGLITDGMLSSPASTLASCCSQIQIKNEEDRLLVVLPAEAEANLELPWSEIWQELKHLIQKKEQSWQPGTFVALETQDRLVDTVQLQAVAETLEEVGLRLTKVKAERRQTAVAAATAGYSVEQRSRTSLPSLAVSEPAITRELLAEPLYIKNTIRSGVEIRHGGSIIICGDLNPGGSVIAAGDIFGWGRLRGVAHAGATGNRQSRVMALQMEFTQLRIADKVARAPQKLPHTFVPEVALISSKGISLAQANDFAKTHNFSEREGAWVRTNN